MKTLEEASLTDLIKELQNRITVDETVSDVKTDPRDEVFALYYDDHLALLANTDFNINQFHWRQNIDDVPDLKNSGVLIWDDAHLDAGLFDLYKWDGFSPGMAIVGWLEV